MKMLGSLGALALCIGTVAHAQGREPPPPSDTEAAVYQSVPGDLEIRINDRKHPYEIRANQPGYAEGIERQGPSPLAIDAVECALLGVVDVCVPKCPNEFTSGVLDTNASATVAQNGDENRPWIFLIGADDYVGETLRKVPVEERVVQFVVWTPQTGVTAFGSSDPTLSRTTWFYVRTSSHGLFQRNTECTTS